MDGKEYEPEIIMLVICLQCQDLFSKYMFISSLVRLLLLRRVLST